MPAQDQYITSAHALDELCQSLKDSARMALDTEFVGEDSFVPKLELIQIATDDTAAVIDFPAVQAAGSMEAFWQIICNPGVQKVLHAGRQDLDLFAFHAGQIPKPFFDTQIAAAMVGFGQAWHVEVERSRDEDRRNRGFGGRSGAVAAPA